MLPHLFRMVMVRCMAFVVATGISVVAVAQPPQAGDYSPASYEVDGEWLEGLVPAAARAIVFRGQGG